MENRQVFRANRTHPEMSDGFGWTYNHAPMLAYWNGKFYLEYLSNPVGEQGMPGQTLLNHVVRRPLVEQAGGGLSDLQIERRQTGDHASAHGLLCDARGKTAGACLLRSRPKPIQHGRHRNVRSDLLHPLQRHAGWNETNTSYPFYKTSPDKSFVAMCDALLQNKLVTLNWWQEDQSPDDFYTVKGNLQALPFYHRPDGAAVAWWKHSLSALSFDEGHSWTKPVKLPTLIMSGARVWGQHTKDGRYALVYNPVDDGTHRYPPAMVTGDDGIHFDHMLFIAADLSPRRFAGNHKDFGLQYVPGSRKATAIRPVTICG